MTALGGVALLSQKSGAFIAQKPLNQAATPSLRSATSGMSATPVTKAATGANTSRAAVAAGAAGLGLLLGASARDNRRARVGKGKSKLAGAEPPKLTAHPKVAGMAATEEARVRLHAFLDKVGAPPPGDEKRPQVEQIAMIALVAAAALAAAEPSLAEEAVEAVTEAAQSGDWFDPIVDFNAGIIAGIDDVIENKLGFANTFGLAIIIYTVIIKAVTFPLNATALRSNAMMQLVNPKVKQIQAKYANDKETQNRMMLRLYDDCGINPLGGCLPAIVQLPIFVSLYRAINRLAEKDIHFQEPFLWIPNLAGPAEPGKPSLDWLLKSQSAEQFVPLIGWHDAGLYMILPILLLVSQFITQKASQPASNQDSGPAGYIVGLFPLIIGYTSLVSPAGLGIYWLFNNALTGAQTALIRNQLSEEYPEYKKLIDGTAAKEEEEKKKRLEEAKFAEPAAVQTGLGKGFAVAPAVAPAVAVDDDEDDDDEEEEEKVGTDISSRGRASAAPAMNRAAAQERRAKRKGGSKRRGRR